MLLAALGVIVFGSRLGLLGETPTTAQEQQLVADMDSFIESIHGIFKETVNLGTTPPALARSLRLPSWRRFAKCLDGALASGLLLRTPFSRADSVVLLVSVYLLIDTLPRHLILTGTF